MWMSRPPALGADLEGITIWGVLRESALKQQQQTYAGAVAETTLMEGKGSDCAGAT